MKKTPCSYSAYVKSADYIMEIIGQKPDIAIILGSGLSAFCDMISDKIVIPYGEIPNFPTSTVSYQKGELVYGTHNGRRVLVMNGRFHYYEGWEMWQTAYPIGVFKVMGVERVIITNAAGGINPTYRPGDIICVYDHIKLTSESPVRGGNIDKLGGRFFEMQSVYDKIFIEKAEAAARSCGITLKRGIYAYMAGPQYETPTEIYMLKKLGADLVGMSTVPEVIQAAHCGIPVLVISCVTNMAAGMSSVPPSEQDVIDEAERIRRKFTNLLSEVIKTL